MRESASQKSELRKQKLREEVERAVEAGEIKLDEPGAGELMRTLGVAFAFFSKTVDVDLASDVSPDVVVGPDQQIQKLLEGWESLAPDQFEASWRDYATDPYIGVGMHWAGVVDDDVVQEWLQSDELAEHEREYPSYSPRKVTLSKVEIVYLEPTRAVATYRVEEEHQNGKLTGGNTAAIVFNVSGKGWRVMVATKGGRDELYGNQ